MVTAGRERLDRGEEALPFSGVVLEGFTCPEQ